MGFRYGDDHHAVIAVWVREADDGTTADACLETFEKWSEPTAHSFSVKVGSPTVVRRAWTPAPGSQPEGQAVSGEAGEGQVVVKSVDAEVSTLFSKTSYSAAYGAYVMWPKTCTIFGLAVPVRDNLELSRAVRDRYVSDGFWRIERHAEAVPNL